MGIPTSDTWHEAISKRFRNQGFLWVGVNIEAPGLREGTTVTASSTAPLFWASAVNDGLDDPVEPMATYEQGRWKADGSQYLPSPISAQNFAASSWADDSTSHTITQYSKLTFQFDQTYSLPGILATWDTETDSWPTRLVIKGYGPNSVLLHNYVITSISSASEFTECPLKDVSKVTMEFQGWSKPGWRARVREVAFGLVLDFTGKQILTASSTSQVDLLSNELPQMDSTVTFTNYKNEFDPLGQSGFSQYLAPKQVVTWQWGFETSPGVVEKLPVQRNYITEVSVPSNSPQFQLGLGTRLDFLTKEYTKGEFTDTPTTLYDLCEHVLRTMDLLPIFDGEQPWELDEGLRNLTTIAPVPNVAENVVLQLLANAAGMVLDTNPINGYIRIAPPTKIPEFTEEYTLLEYIESTGPVLGVPEHTITGANTMGDPEIDIRAPILSIKVGVNQYSRAETRTEIYKSTLKMSGTKEIKVTYNNRKLALDVVVDAVTGGTLVSSKIYSREAILVVSVPADDTSVDIRLTGFVYEENRAVFETYRDDTIDKGLEITVDNPFITSTDFLGPINTATYAVHSRRHLASATYQGYPEMLGGDVLELMSRYGDVRGWVTRASIDYNGGWSGAFTARVEGG